MRLIDILHQYGVPLRQHGESKDVRHGWIGLNCPWCGRPEDKFYLGCHLARQFMTCWSCGYVKLVPTLAALIREPAWKVRDMLDQLERPEDLEQRPRGRLELPKGVGPLLELHESYLRSRGFDPDELSQLWKIKGIGIAAKLQWRIFIPVIWQGQTCSWTTRSLTNQEPRYISAPAECEAVPVKQMVYGGDFVRETVMIHEGPADAWAVGPGAVSLMGLSFSPEQVLWLSKVPVRYVCFDSEPAAQTRASQLCDQLEGFPGETHNIRLFSKDPASATLKERRKLRELVG
jgi:hypothetical protein